MLGREIDIDVRSRRHLLVEEPLEEQVVGDRVDPGDTEQIGDDAVGRRPTTLAGNPVCAGKSHQVPVDQEELGKPGLVDDIELALETGRHLRRHRAVSLPDRLLAEPV